MKSIFFVAADYANVTPEGKLNIMGLFDRIWASRFPAKHSMFHMVAKVALEFGDPTSGEHNFTIKMIDEDANEEFSLTPPRTFKFPERVQPGIEPDHNLVLGVRDMVFRRPGVYEFKLFVNDVELDSFLLTLVVREQQKLE